MAYLFVVRRDERDAHDDIGVAANPASLDSSLLFGRSFLSIKRVVREIRLSITRRVRFLESPSRPLAIIDREAPDYTADFELADPKI